MKRNLHFTDAQVANLLTQSAPYLSCDDCFDRIDEYVEDMLAEPAHLDPPMQTHLHACGACAEEAATLFELISREE